MRQINLIQVLSDIGAGKRGSHLGAIQLAEQISLRKTVFENHEQTEFFSPPTKYIDNLHEFFQQMLPALAKNYTEPDFPLILSGDHSNAIGTISALCHAYPTKRIGVIWIDAHADLHTPYTTPSGNLHGMSLAALIRQDNQTHAIHSLNAEQQTYWQQLKQLAPDSQGILPQDLCFLGLRDYEVQEQALLEQFNIPHFSVEAIRQMGLDNVLALVRKQFEEVDLVYVSFDVDSLDSTLFFATGTPVPNGFTEQELGTILMDLLHYPNLKAFEITEFNPSLADDSKQDCIIQRLFRQSLDIIQKG